MPHAPFGQPSSSVVRADMLAKFGAMCPLAYVTANLPFTAAGRTVTRRAYLVAATQARDLRISVPLFPLVCAAIEDFTRQIANNSVTGDQTEAFEKVRSAAISLARESEAAFCSGHGALALQPMIRLARRWADLNEAAHAFCREGKIDGGIVVVVPTAMNSDLDALPRFIRDGDAIKVERAG